MARAQNKPVEKQVSTNKVRYIVPIIGLGRPEKPTLTKGEYVVLKCRTDPLDENSSTYDLPIPYYSGRPKNDSVS